MTWQTGTATDYLDLMDQVKQVATSTHMSAPVINAAGTGYSVDDILTVVGGTSTHVATIRVLTVGGSGEVLTMRMETGGAYTSNPSLTANAVTDTGAGSAATVDLTAVSTGWTKKRATQEAVSAIIGAGGTGYSVSDVLTIVGGVGVGTVATFTVASLGGGTDVATVTLTAAGDYEEMPSSPAATTVAPSGGTGCTLTVTAQDSTGTTERVLVLEGNGGASESILVGMKSYQATDVSGFLTCHNWSCHAFTAFNASLEFHDLVGISPGLDNVGAVKTTTGSFLVLKEDTGATYDISFWFNFTNRRLIIVAKVEDALETNYASAYLGYMNQFGTSAEFPYPILVGASSARHNTHYTDTVPPRFTGIGEVVGLSGKTGPMWYLRSDSAWTDIKNSTAFDTAAPSRTASSAFTLYPGAIPSNTIPDAEDDIILAGAGVNWVDIIPNSGVPGAPNMKLQDTPMTGGDLKLLVPHTIIASNGNFREILGELDDVFWFSAVGGVSPEDTITDGSEIYRVFANGNRAEEFSMFALKETF